ncbi:MAG: type II CAAX endopeptidase family protein [Methanobacteriota archaeon]
MEFTIKKPAHFVALFFLVLSFLILIVLPVISFFIPFSSVPDSLGQFPPTFQLAVEILTLLMQLVLAFFLLLIVPLLWYALVNKINLKEILSRLKLTKQGLDIALLWGFLLVIFIFIILLGIGFILTLVGVNTNDISNITEISQIFSPISLFALSIIQPIGEEIFFRGFLLEKIHTLAGKTSAIGITAVLFGLAHLSYGNIYPAIMTGLIGVFLAILVIKTKNLYASIFAHILYNITSLTLYFISMNFVSQTSALIL